MKHPTLSGSIKGSPSPGYLFVCLKCDKSFLSVAVTNRVVYCDCGTRAKLANHPQRMDYHASIQVERDKHQKWLDKTLARPCTGYSSMKTVGEALETLQLAETTLTDITEWTGLSDSIARKVLAVKQLLDTTTDYL